MLSYLASYLAPASPFDAPSLPYQILSGPFAFLARLLYTLFVSLRPLPSPSYPPITVVCVSDTHTRTKNLPPGDLLIHAGDLCNNGSVSELREQISWLHSQPHAHKVVIAGNHDTYLDPRARRTLSKLDQEGIIDWGTLHYLQHSSITLTFPRRGNRRLLIYGAPQIPACGGPEHAFQYTRGQDAWTETVNPSADILVTHTPPKWHLDLPAGLGCEWLLEEVQNVQPRLHVFGHVHNGAGRSVASWDSCQAAYERICFRSTNPLLSLFYPRNWADLIVLITSGLKWLIWGRLWGGERSGTILVNAAQMNEKTGQIENPAQVVHI